MNSHKLLICLASLGIVGTQYASSLTQTQQTAEKIRVEALQEEWARLRQRMTDLNNESDPVKKVTILKEEAQGLVEKGRQLVEKIKGAPITPESKEKLEGMIAQSGELKALKGDWEQLRDNLSKIAAEKDNRKRMELMKDEGKRLIEKGKDYFAKAKVKAGKLADYFRKK